jgi:hypothetical protein
MSRRFRPTLETLERREVFSAGPLPAPHPIDAAQNDSAYVSRPYLEQDNRFQGDRNQQQIIAILIG